MTLKSASPVPADASWSTRFLAPGADSTVYAVDARGDTLVVAGDFDRLGSHACHSIALYDGAAWQDLGGGFPGSVRAVCWWNGLLTAGGEFRMSGGAPGDFLAQWDGVSWQALPVQLDGPVYALTVHQGKLAVGGSFLHAGPNPAAGVALWDGTTWSPAGTGINGGTHTVFALLSTGDSLYVGGRFDSAGDTLVHNIAMWGGGAWHGMGGGVDSTGSVFALASFRGEIHAGGAFLKAGGTKASSIAAWNGIAWRGLNSTNLFHARAIVTYLGSLVVTGGFAQAGNATNANNVALWNGASWAALRSGLYLHETFGSWFDDYGWCATVYHGALYVGGHFTLADSLSSPFLARWDGSAWSTALDGNGLAFDAMCFLPRADSLIVGGAFFSAGTRKLGYIGAWDGHAWWPLGQGCSSDVYTLAEYHGEIIAGGAFTRADGQVVNGVARWDGVAWHPMGTSGTPGVNSWVVALHVWHDTLYAGGFFTTVDGQPIRYLAAWDGTQWSDPGAQADQWVNALGEWGGKLVVGGAFTAIGGQAAQCIATWDGHTWDTLGGGLTSYAGYFTPRVYTVAEYRGELVAGGDFDTSDQFGDMQCLASWNGTRWQEVGINGVEAYYGLRPSSVMALEARGGYLVAGGFATRFGQSAAQNVARWDGTTWHALGSGVSFFYPDNGAVWAVATWKDSLYVGGNIVLAGGQKSDYWAQWDNADLAMAPVRGGIADGPPAQPNETTFRALPRTDGVAFVSGLALVGRRRVQILDARGRRVATCSANGVHSARWDGRVASGSDAATGVYVAVLEDAGRVVARTRFAWLR